MEAANSNTTMSGCTPAEPDYVKATVLDERKDGEVTLRMVELSFGPRIGHTDRRVDDAAREGALFGPGGHRPIAASAISCLATSTIQ